MSDKKNTNSSPGAGFILVKDRKVRKILALITHKGLYDLPKGTLDSTDLSFLYCAKRECFEECSIKVKNSDLIKSVPAISTGKLVIFTARTNQKPKITKNPHSGILEHTGYKWVTPEDFKKNTHEYLAKAVEEFENYCFLF